MCDVCVAQQTRGFISHFNLCITGFCRLSWCLHTKSTISVHEIIRVSVLFTDLTYSSSSFISIISQKVYLHSLPILSPPRILPTLCGPLERNIFHLRCNTFSMFVFFFSGTECIVKEL